MALILVFASNVAAQGSVAGTWELTYNPGDGEHSAILTIEETDSKLSAGYVDTNHEGDREFEVTAVDFTDDKLTFSTSSGNSTVKFEGIVKGDAVTGSAEWEFDGMTGAFEFEGKKKAQPKNSSPNEISRETVAYSNKDGTELLLDKYANPDTPAEGKRPAIIYVHGGGFETGSRVNALQIKYCKHFVERGFVAFAIDYRLGLQGVENKAEPKAVPNAVAMAVEDLLDATAFILRKAEEWNIDTEKVIISGGSAGAVTCLGAEYDICTTNKLSDRLPEGFNYAGIISHAGCITAKQEPEWKKKPCPMLLMHGSKDQLVAFEKSELPGSILVGSKFIHEQLKDLNVPNWLYEEVGADHIVALKPLQHNFPEIDAFIDKFVLKGEHAIVHTKWADEVPDSMDKMFQVVPLYMIGWEKTDEEVENSKE